MYSDSPQACACERGTQNQFAQGRDTQPAATARDSDRRPCGCQFHAKYGYQVGTYIIDFLAIESACSSTPLSFQNVKSSISLCEPSWSGHSASGTKSSSDHSLEHSDGLTRSRSTGRPPPMYLHKDFCSYLRRDVMTQSAIGSVLSRGVGKDTLWRVKSWR